jgi:hypothetical protein
VQDEGRWRLRQRVKQLQRAGGAGEEGGGRWSAEGVGRWLELCGVGVGGGWSGAGKRWKQGEAEASDGRQRMVKSLCLVLVISDNA